MKAESDIIYAILNNDVALTTIVNDKIFPLMAHQDMTLPFITYHISESPVYSKEGKVEIIVTVNSYDKDYNKAALLADTVKAAFANETVPEFFTYLDGVPNYNEEGLLSVNQNFKFKNV